MAKEREEVDLSGALVTGIFVDLRTKTALLSAKDRPVAMFRLAPEGLIFHAVTHHSATEPPDEVQPLPGSEAGPAEETEKEKPQTLQGRLKSKPKQGRSDRTGKPTAWARFAAHEEGQEGAHLYSTTFHRHTAEIALSLERETPITLQGYPHLNDDPGSKRMDTLSVINVLDYPGKPKAK